MKEHPVLFSAPMVRAILAGQKTVTRRLVRVDDTPVTEADAKAFRRQRGIPSDAQNLRFCGDYLKCDAPAGSFTVSSRVNIPYGLPGDRLWVRETWRYESDGVAMYRADVRDELAHRAKWRPGIHLRREHARLTLEVEGVRIERLHAIDEADARAEGVAFAGRTTNLGAREDFAALWDDINSKRAPWDSNPWVWRVVFRRLP